MTAFIGLREPLRRGDAPVVGAGAIVRGPPLRALRRVAVPWPRLEAAELLVHDVQLREQLYEMPAGVAVVRVDVVAGPVAPRAPDQVDAVAPKRVAGRLDVGPVPELVGHVVHDAGPVPAQQVQSVMVGAAAQEDEEVPDPIRPAKAQRALVPGREAR